MPRGYPDFTVPTVQASVEATLPPARITAPAFKHFYAPMIPLEVNVLTAFKNKLIASVGPAGQIWSFDTEWVKEYEAPERAAPEDWRMTCWAHAAFGDYLYLAGRCWNDPTIGSTACYIRTTGDGVWKLYAFPIAYKDMECFRLQVFKGKLYAALCLHNTDILESSDGLTWTKVYNVVGAPFCLGGYADEDKMFFTTCSGDVGCFGSGRPIIKFDGTTWSKTADTAEDLNELFYVTTEMQGHRYGFYAGTGHGNIWYLSPDPMDLGSHYRVARLDASVIRFRTGYAGYQTGGPFVYVACGYRHAGGSIWVSDSMWDYRRVAYTMVEGVSAILPWRGVLFYGTSWGPKTVAIMYLRPEDIQRNMSLYRPQPVTRFLRETKSVLGVSYVWLPWLEGPGEIDTILLKATCAASAGKNSRLVIEADGDTVNLPTIETIVETFFNNQMEGESADPFYVYRLDTAPSHVWGIAFRLNWGFRWYVKPKFENLSVNTVDIDAIIKYKIKRTF